MIRLSCSFVSPSVTRMVRMPPSTIRRFISTLSNTTDVAFLRSEVNRFDKNIPVEKATTPPSSWYTQASFHDLDMRSVFSNNWVAVGCSKDVVSTGEYITGRISGEPYVITRDRKSTLRAFYNVCRHHGTIILDNRKGQADCLVCPYHGWTYGLDGRLTKANRLKSIQDFKAKDFGLVPIDVQEWGPLIFLNFNSESSATWPKTMHPLKTQLNLSGFSNESVRFVKRQVYNVKCNWKVFVDNYLDGGYHVPYAHRQLAGKLDISSYETQIHDGYSIQSCGGTDARTYGGALYAHIYPNILINRYGSWLDLNIVIPLDNETCDVVFYWFLNSDVYASTPLDKLDHMIEQNLSESDIFQQEDIALCERVQSGLNSRSYDCGRYAPLVEHADHYFHTLLSDDYNLCLNHP